MQTPRVSPLWVQGLHNVNLLEDLGGLEIPGLPAHSRSGDSSPWNTILLQGWIEVKNRFFPFTKKLEKPEIYNLKPLLQHSMNNYYYFKYESNINLRSHISFNLDLHISTIVVDLYEASRS